VLLGCAGRGSVRLHHYSAATEQTESICTDAGMGKTQPTAPEVHGKPALLLPEVPQFSPNFKPHTHLLRTQLCSSTAAGCERQLGGADWFQLSLT
jgi:hypothetical protein